MATKRRTNTRQLALRMGINDERIPKLLGVVLLFIALYLFIAFTSYLFTWEEDMDKVFRFKVGVLLDSSITMDNWLGRLGAIVSNAFFYWGFGFPSFIFIYLLVKYGLGMIKRIPIKTLLPILKQSLVWLIFFSILFEFIFFNSEFPWGGAFGESICAWLKNFVGVIGVIVLLIFILVGLIIWNANPNFNELTFEKALEDIQYWFNGLWNKRYRTKKPEEETATALRPGGNHGQKRESRKPQKDKQLSEEGQLAINLKNKQKEKPKTLSVGDAELEIKAPETPLIPVVPGVQQELPGLEKPIPQPTLSAEKENRNHSEPYDPTLDLSSYEHPVLALLEDYSDQKVEVDRAELEANKDQIIETLLNYKIEITKIRATIGPTVTLYEIVPAPGVRISKIKNLEDDIALSLAALGIRIIAPIPGRGTIGIEVPNKKKQIVSLKETLLSDKFKRAKMDLPIALGKTISNEVFVADLAKMPHLLIAGATGQGKSVGINTILMSLLYKKHPSQVKLVLIDPKKVELFPYAKLENHFLAYLPDSEEPITTETNKVVHTLNSLTIEMEMRYNLLKKASARNIREYNEKFVNRRLNPEKGHRFLPFIVLVIDEFADLIMTAGKEVELPIGRLAQLARAVGIHLIIATQRPSVNIITGVIKANFPARIAYKVTAKVDSRTILDAGGADQLIGRGDMLLSVGGDMIRLQCGFVDTPEVEKVIDFIAQQQGYPTPHFLPEFHGDEEEHSSSGGFSLSDLDDNWEDAARLVVSNQHGSTSMIQRRLKLGYNRAGRIMDQLEALGIVGPSEGSKPREVLMYGEPELERYLKDVKTRK